MDDPKLTSAQQQMVALWERHLASEFQDKQVDETMATMTSNPYVNHIAVMTGGVGADAVRRFYSTFFIPCQPPDTEIVPVTRTVGADRIVDELIHKFTHTIEMPWMVPGIPPTGRHVELAVTVVVQFQDGKIAGEHIYWDQASVLAQLGLLDAHHLPITGIEQARQAVEPTQELANQLIRRAQ